jgi:DNA-binding CsgD family transcriptional regulator
LHDRPSLDDFLEELASAGDGARPAAADRIWALTVAHFAANGFDKIIHVDMGPGRTSMRTTLSDAWVARYRSQGYAKIDPFLTRCCATFRPISTGIAYADLHDGLSAAQMTLIDEASTFGINAGFSVTVERLGPEGAAGWNIGSSLSRGQVDALRTDREADLRLAAHHAHVAFKRAGCPAPVPLSPRESECLRWLAQGYRTKEIAQELTLSTAAVELYLRNARRKLGAATREQAIAIVTAQGRGIV